MPAPCQIWGRGKCWEQRPSLDTKPHNLPGTCGESQGFSSCSEPSTCSGTAAASQGLTRPQNLRHHSLLQLGGTTLGVLHRSRLHRSHGHRQQRRCTSWHVPQHHQPAMRQAGLGAAPRRAVPSLLGAAPPCWDAHRQLSAEPQIPEMSRVSPRKLGFFSCRCLGPRWTAQLTPCALPEDAAHPRVPTLCEEAPEPTQLPAPALLPNPVPSAPVGDRGTTGVGRAPRSSTEPCPRAAPTLLPPASSTNLRGSSPAASSGAEAEHLPDTPITLGISSAYSGSLIKKEITGICHLVNPCSAAPGELCSRETGAHRTSSGTLPGLAPGRGPSAQVCF